MNARILILPALLVTWGHTLAPLLQAAPPSREIFVPVDDLPILLRDQPKRVMLSRDQYNDLIAKSKRDAPEATPLNYTFVTGEYSATVSQERAEFAGTLTLDILEPGIHAIPLNIAGVGIRSITLDGKPAPVGRSNPTAMPTLFVEGIGRHTLTLDLVSFISTTAARQTLDFQIPAPAAARMRLTIPGDVEVKGGAHVITRDFDAEKRETFFELLPAKNHVSLVMSLNSRLLRKQRVVVARGVVIDEITQAYERLHVTYSMDILHRAIGEFRFAIPAGFEITKVESPRLAKWAVEAVDNQPTLIVSLHEETAEDVILNITAIRTPARLESWSMPQLTPLDVTSRVAVLGVLAEDNLTANAVTAEGLFPIDTTVITEALPPSVFEADATAPRIRPVVAYYSPHPNFELTGSYTKPEPELHATSNILLTLDDKAHQVSGGILLRTEAERRFDFEFTMPLGWQLQSITDAQSTPLKYETYDLQDSTLVYVALPRGLSLGVNHAFYFTAQHTPPNWLTDWETQSIRFPNFAILKATRDEGAIALVPGQDMEVRSESLDGLSPLDENEKAKFGLTNNTGLAYRYSHQPYNGAFHVKRLTPRVTSQNYAFFAVSPGSMKVHYELAIQADRARMDEIQIRLPSKTPEVISIQGLDGITLKEYDSLHRGPNRFWTVKLAEPKRGMIRLAIDFNQTLDDADESTQPLPIPEVLDVAYQSGYISVEGHAELDVKAVDVPRKVDVGELVDAQYQPGRRLLGVYGYVTKPENPRVQITRHAKYTVPTAVIENGYLLTLLSGNGRSQTRATYNIRTSVPFVEVELPEKSNLWSVTIDSAPAQPQREGDTLLIGFPESGHASQALTLVYESPVAPISFWGGIDLKAPKLYLRPSGNKQRGREIPQVSVDWNVAPPNGYSLFSSSGSVMTSNVPEPKPAALTIPVTVARVLTPRPDAFIYSLGFDSSSAYPQEDAVAMDPSVVGAWGRMEYEEDAEMSLMDSIDEAMPKPAATPEPAPELAKRDMLKEKKSQVAATEEAFTNADRLEAIVPQQPQSAPTRPSQSGRANYRPIDSPTEAPAQAGDPTGGGQTDGRVSLSKDWTLEGVRSLDINIESLGPTIHFQSLGEQPMLGITLVNANRLRLFGWGIALLFVLIGLRLTTRCFYTKTKYIIGVITVASAVPLILGSPELLRLSNYAAYGVAWLIPYYLAAGIVRWFFRTRLGNWSLRTSKRIALGTAAMLVLGLAPSIAQAAPPKPSVIHVVEALTPSVPIPSDAVLIPYNPDRDLGIQEAKDLFVPYDEYVRLKKLVEQNENPNERPAPTDFVLAGATYRSTLQGDHHIIVSGTLHVDVLGDKAVNVPLVLNGGVLASAKLNDAPAQVNVIQPRQVQTPMQQAPNAPAQQADQQKAVVQPRTPAPIAAVLIDTKGRHEIAIEVHMNIERRGGWRVVSGHLTATPGTMLDLTVPEVETDIRLSWSGQNVDKRTFQTGEANEHIKTTIADNGAIGIQWRPRIGEGQVDQSLTVESKAVFEVQEDRHRLVWHSDLKFRHGERDFFRLRVPADYLVENITGLNVRGWAQDTVDGHLQIDISLLKPARQFESFVVYLWKPETEPRNPTDAFVVPYVVVDGASLHNGSLAVRRGPMIDLRTVSTSGVSRTEINESEINRLSQGAGGADESPLGIRPHQSFRFTSVPFDVRMTAREIKPRSTANVQSVYRISDQERTIESKVHVTVRDRSVHRIRLAVPESLRLTHVSVPGPFEWSRTIENSKSVVTLYLAAGMDNRIPVVLRGTFGRPTGGNLIPIPRIEVMDMTSQSGAIAIQVDPVYDVRPQNLTNCTFGSSARVRSWIDRNQREMVRASISYGRPNYGGFIELIRRSPKIECVTVSNVLVTDRTLDETILLNFSIKESGIRSIQFQLPAWMKDARISVPLLRQKTIEGLTPSTRWIPSTYTVQPNDTLGKIAERFYGDRSLFVDIIKLNGLKRPISIEVGQTLKLPELNGTRHIPDNIIAPVDTVRITLDLQDEVMGDLRVLVENDRLLTGNHHLVPIPVVETGSVSNQFVALEGVGRDEVTVDQTQQIDKLADNTDAWASLSKLLGGSLSQAYIVQSDAKNPALRFMTRQRVAVETAGARIGLAELKFVMDENGAYRAAQSYRVDNSTEQYLEVLLDEGVRVWTVHVAGEPVKPAAVSGQSDRYLRVPLIKTALGDLDYQVIIKYGGKLEALGVGASLDIPTIHTQNIAVELSQVRLYLPTGYRWYGFDGTMRLIDDEATLEAEIMSYKSKVAQRLLQTLRGESGFSKARAAANLKKFQAENYSYRQTVQSRSSGRNRELARELRDNEGIMQQAEQELQELSKNLDESDGKFANTGKLQDAYLGQDISRAKNAVQSLDLNFDATDAAREVETKKDESRSFNRQWFESNKLQKQKVPESKSEMLNERLRFKSHRKSDKMSKEADQQAPLLTQPSIAGPKPGAVIADPKKPTSRTNDRFSNNGQGLSPNSSEEATKGGKLNRMLRYQQRLESNFQQQAQVTNDVNGLSQQRFDQSGRGLRPTAPQPSSGQFRGSESTVSGGAPMNQPTGVGGRAALQHALGNDSSIITSGTVDPGLGIAVPSGYQAGEHGFVSLDVNIPFNGKVFRLTSPRGDMRIEVSSISRGVERNARQLAGIAACLFALWSLVWIKRRVVRLIWKREA